MVLGQAAPATERRAEPLEHQRRHGAGDVMAAVDAAHVHLRRRLDRAARPQPLQPAAAAEGGLAKVLELGHVVADAAGRQVGGGVGADDLRRLRCHGVCASLLAAVGCCSGDAAVGKCCIIDSKCVVMHVT